jgi:hypothetical protein
METRQMRGLLSNFRMGAVGGSTLHEELGQVVARGFERLLESADVATAISGSQPLGCSARLQQSP